MIKKLRYYIRNCKLKEQMFFSYVAVGILPFLIFSFCIIQLTNQQLKISLMNGLDTVFHNSSASLQREAEKVQNAMDIIALDSSMASILTMEYKSNYDKYVNITGYFDSFITAVTVANPEIIQFDFYVDNGLADIRQNFHSLTETKILEQFPEISHSIEAQWYFQDGNFIVLQKVFHPSMNGKFAVIAATLPYHMIVDAQSFEGISYQITLRDQVITEFDTPLKDQNFCRSVSILNDAGTLQCHTGEIYHSVRTLIFVSLGIFMAFLLLLFTISRFAEAFARRIRAINRTLSETVRNNFSVTFSEEYGDEIGDLTKMLNQMIRETKQLIQDVYESQIKEREYEMKALQAQINPHFLYNTLSAINWHALTTNNTEISEIVTALSKFYRTALNQGNNVTTVQNELDNIRAYVQIQQKIHNYSFDVIYEIAEDVLSCRMPNLIIQPIVENAIEHGIDLKTEGRGCLWIRAWRDGVNLLLEIADNGLGITESSIEQLLRQDSKSYGLQNVDKRLRLFYGENYHMKYFFQDGAVFQLFLPNLN